VSAVDLDKVRSILTGSVDHYAAELHQGEQILGTQAYPDASAGLAATDISTSSAARFRDYRQKPGPERDLSTWTLSNRPMTSMRLRMSRNR
jgi:hypothetical protein